MTSKLKCPTPWNIQDHLKTNEERVNYLEAALEENDKQYIAVALWDIAESLGISELSMFAAKTVDIKVRNEVLKPSIKEKK